MDPVGKLLLGVVAVLQPEHQSVELLSTVEAPASPIGLLYEELCAACMEGVTPPALL